MFSQCTPCVIDCLLLVLTLDLHIGCKPHFAEGEIMLQRCVASLLFDENVHFDDLQCMHAHIMRLLLAHALGFASE